MDGVWGVYVVEMKNDVSTDAPVTYILVYQNSENNTTVVRRIWSKCADQLVYVLMDIFSTVGVPVLAIGGNDVRAAAARVVNDLYRTGMINEAPYDCKCRALAEPVTEDLTVSVSRWMENNQVNNLGTPADFMRSIESLHPVFMSESSAIRNRGIETTAAAPPTVRRGRPRKETMIGKTIKIEVPARYRVNGGLRFIPGVILSGESLKIHFLRLNSVVETIQKHTDTNILDHLVFFIIMQLAC